MRLIDFDIGRPGHGHRDDNALSRAFVEEFRYELAERPRVYAPFGKLVIDLYACDEELPSEDARLLLDIAAVRLRSDLHDLRDSSTRTAFLCDAVVRGLELVERDLDWSSPVLLHVTSTLRARERLGWIELTSLARKHRRTGMTVRVYYEVSPARTAVHAIVLDAEGAELQTHLLASSDTLRPLEWLFPVRSAVLREDTFFLRDKTRHTLASLAIN